MDRTESRSYRQAVESMSTDTLRDRIRDRMARIDMIVARMGTDARATPRWEHDQEMIRELARYLTIELADMDKR